MCPLADVGNSSISVLVADDSVIIREGVRAMLAAEADLDVVGAAEDYDALVAGRRDRRAAGDRVRHPDAAELPA